MGDSVFSADEVDQIRDAFEMGNVHVDIETSNA